MILHDVKLDKAAISTLTSYDIQGKISVKTYAVHSAYDSDFFSFFRAPYKCSHLLTYLLRVLGLVITAMSASATSASSNCELVLIKSHHCRLAIAICCHSRRR